MKPRFLTIWFRYLVTDWFALRQPQLNDKPFVVKASSHGRMIVVAVNAKAEAQGIYTGMALADARAIVHDLEAFDEKPGLAEKLLKKLAEWCIRFTPFVCVDLPNGLVLDISGCAHLWGGEENYLKEITGRLGQRGYYVRAAIADTIGAAWAVARYGRPPLIIKPNMQYEALLPLPPASLRIEAETIEYLHKLGLRQVSGIINIPRAALRRRFGQLIIKRLHQALGMAEEYAEPVVPVVPYQERLPCIEPIVTATGIEIALQRLLDTLCKRLQNEDKGLRQACLKCYRLDGKIEQVDIATHRSTYSVKHLLKLFEIKLPTIEPDLGIELFVLEAPKVEACTATQNQLWNASGGLHNIQLTELIDRIAGKLGENVISRYLPDEHYWPERSVRQATSLHEEPSTAWRLNTPRPIQMLPHPEPIAVTAPVPDYPPMNFRYKGKLHTIKRADGPERIEQEWWLQEGKHRDYYVVEDEEGCRYWVFRLGHYEEDYKWFIHGFFG